MTGFLVKDRQFYSSLLVLTIPMMLQNLLRISVDTFNSILLGGVGQLEMAAVSQADQVFFIYYTICNGLATGCCVLVAQYWGQRNIKAIRTVLATALRSMALLGLGFSLLVMAVPQGFMHIYSSDPEVIALGAAYLRKAALMYLPAGLSLMIFAGCRGVEQVRIVLYTNIVSYALNIFLNYCLLDGRFGLPALGVTGIAVGAIVSRLVELLICGAYLFRLEKNISFRFSHLKWRSKQLSRDLFAVSAPIVAHEVVWSLGTSAGNVITGQLATSVVTGYNMSMAMSNMMGSLGSGLLHASSVIIGKTIGSGYREKVKDQSRTLLLLTFVVGILQAGIILLIRRPFMSLYNVPADTLVYAGQFLFLTALIRPFADLEMVTMVGILRAGGDGKTGFYADLVIMGLICIPLAAAAAFLWNAPPVAVVCLIKLVVVLETVVGIHRVLSMKWIRDLTHHAE